MIRKGQVRWLEKGDVIGQIHFIQRLLPFHSALARHRCLKRSLGSVLIGQFVLIGYLQHIRNNNSGTGSHRFSTRSLRTSLEDLSLNSWWAMVG